MKWLLIIALVLGFCAGWFGGRVSMVLNLAKAYQLTDTDKFLLHFYVPKD